MTSADEESPTDWERRFDALVTGGLRPAEAAAWMGVHQPAVALREVEQWRRLTGLKPLDAWQWFGTGIGANAASAWVNSGWTYDQYRMFHRLHNDAAWHAHHSGAPAPGGAVEWRDSGIPPERCIGYICIQMTLDQALAVEERHHSDGTSPDEALAMLLALRPKDDE